MMKQSKPATLDQPVTGAPESSTNVYRDIDGNECTLLELCRKEPEWAANTIREFRTERDRLKKAVGCSLSTSATTSARIG